MKTISEEIRALIAESPFLEEGLARGIINCSALAREMQPRIESALMRDVSEGAVLMALKRAQPTLQARRRDLRPLLKQIGDLTVRSNLAEMTYRRSPRTLEKQGRLLGEIRDLGDQFITLTQGSMETTIITSASLVPTIEKVYRGEDLVARLDDLAAIVIRLPTESVDQPGVHYTLLKQLAWHDINLVEAVSTYSEFTIVLRRAVVDRAFTVLMEFLAP
jgi:hypothetical protein